MIVGLSTIQDEGAGFRTRLFAPRWNFLKESLRQVEFPSAHAVRVRIVLGQVESRQEAQGFEDASTFVVETRIPIAEFKQLSIGEKSNRVLDVIFQSINVAYAYFGETPSPDVDRIWQEARAIGQRQ
jgi:hypothetical protein